MATILEIERNLIISIQNYYLDPGYQTALGICHAEEEALPVQISMVNPFLLGRALEALAAFAAANPEGEMLISFHMNTAGIYTPTESFLNSMRLLSGAASQGNLNIDQIRSLQEHPL